jgi:hypothetical protein
MNSTILRSGVARMSKNNFFVSAMLVMVFLFAQNTLALDYWSLADQSTYRCPGGVVAVGDSDRSVRENCGDPLDITSREDKGPIWVYHFGQDRFMYYLEFVFGKLERILSTPCNRDNYECFDLN